MKILAIDTSAHLCAACVFDSAANTILAKNTEDIGRGHAERLMAVIAATLAVGKLSYEDLERIAVTCGPGSFTGVRVGLATARGLALGLDIAAVGINTLEGLESLALQDGISGPLATLKDARRDEVYFRITGFGDPDKNQDGAVASYKDVAHSLADEDLVLCGSGAEILNAHLTTPRPVNHQLAAVPIETVARIGAEKTVDAAGPQPAYLRQPDAKPQAGFALPLESFIASRKR